MTLFRDIACYPLQILLPPPDSSSAVRRVALASIISQSHTSGSASNTMAGELMHAAVALNTPTRDRHASVRSGMDATTTPREGLAILSIKVHLVAVTVNLPEGRPAQASEVGYPLDFIRRDIAIALLSGKAASTLASPKFQLATSPDRGGPFGIQLRPRGRDV